MIKVYTEGTLLTAENRPNVFPLLFDMHYNEMPDPRISDHYTFTTNPAEADVFVYPIDINGSFKRGTSADLLSTISGWKQYKKPIWVYTSGDYGITVNDPEITQFRFGGFASKFPTQTEVMPAFIQDPYITEEVTPFYLPKPKMPTVGFVGFSSKNMKIWAKACASTMYGNIRRILGKEPTDRQAIYPAAYHRKQYLDLLEGNPDIGTTFIHRGQYRAGASSPEERAETTTTFFNNIFNTPYTLCVRGAGNFSVRFYEVLASGRIPLVIDTDIKLPLENSIDWTKYAVIVHTSKSVAIALQEWHETTESKDFEAVQKRNRALWKSYLTRESYFCRIHDQLKP